MLEMAQKAAIALVDSPLITKGVIMMGAGSAAGRYLDLLPDVISITGGLVAIVAGTYLIKRHKKAMQLDDARREGVRLQNAHDAKVHEHSDKVREHSDKMRDIELEMTRLELERFKAENCVK